MPPNLKKWCPLLFVFLLIVLTSCTSTAETIPNTHDTIKELSDPSLMCDTCELPLPPPPPACPPPPPPPCPPPPPPPCLPPPPKEPCDPCSETPEVKPPPTPLGYILGGQGVYSNDPYVADEYSGQIRSSAADVSALLGLWALLGVMMWA